MNVENIVDVKQKNVKRIIDFIRFRDDSTKKEIAQELELSFATVSNICNELKSIGIIEERDIEDTKSVGRAPKAVVMNYKEFYILCLDLHIKNIVKISLLNFRNEIIKEHCMSYEDSITIHDFIKTCHTQFQQYILDAGIVSEHIIGIGVAVPGIFDKATGNIIASEIELFENQPVKSMLIEEFRMSVYIDNESNLCAVSTSMPQLETSCYDNAIYIYVGEGLGIGVVTQGELLRGERGYAPEICHIPIGSPNYQCHLCGSHECVQSDLSIYGFAAKYFGEYEYKKENVLKRWDTFVNKVREKQDKALAVVKENAVIMGRLISILINLFDPCVVYIGGAASAVFDELYPIIKPEVDKRLVVNRNRDIEIKVDKESDYTIITGAAEMVFERWMPQL